MVNRLEPLDLMDFTGGLNLRASAFQLANNESPDLLNVDIDPRGGFYTRKGWERWNTDDIVDVETATWRPRSVHIHTFANNTQQVYVANDHTLYAMGSDGVAAPLAGLVGNATPHMFDYAAWGDDLYIVTGMFGTSYRRRGLTPPTPMTPDSWSEVDAPIRDVMPRAEYVAAHAGYMFAAVTTEGGNNYYARLRWSHPAQPDSWRADDYIDIDSGGGRITALMSFRDHLLIFKTNSMWALYGYDEESWQLIKVSTSVGCPCITAVTRSETAVMFYSASDLGGIYAYDGDSPRYISENLRPAFEQILAYTNVFASWAGRRLWVSVPWTRHVGPTTDLSSCFVYDVGIGQNGAWTLYAASTGAIGPVLDGSDVNAQRPLTAYWSDNVATMVALDAIDDAYDAILLPTVLGYTPSGDTDYLIGYIVTGLDEEIGLTGDVLIGESFDSYYRTPWLHAGWPDRKKSWRRPTFICRQVPRSTDLLVETFRDYNETLVHRSRVLRVRAEGAAYWTETGYAEADIGGFDWTEGGAADPTGTGADWGEQRQGANLVRSGSLGLARSVQVRVRASTSTPRQRWGVDGIVMKFVNRRFR